MANKKDSRKITKRWTDIEIKSLIEHYEERPDLWDPSRPKYMDRVVKESLVAEIATKLGIPADEVKSKFHSLRSQFNRECNKERNTKSGAGRDENYVSKWTYKSSLQFLQISTATGSTTSSLVIVDNTFIKNAHVDN